MRGCIPFNFNFLPKSLPYKRAGRGQSMTVRRAERKMRRNKDGSGKRKKKEPREREASSGDEERAEAASTLFHAHHPFYILISPLSRRPFKAFCPLTFSLPLPLSLPLSLSFSIVLRVSLPPCSFPSSARWHPFNIIMFPPCWRLSLRASVSLFLTLPHRPFVMV